MLHSEGWQFLRFDDYILYSRRVSTALKARGNIYLVLRDIYGSLQIHNEKSL